MGISSESDLETKLMNVEILKSRCSFICSHLAYMPQFTAFSRADRAVHSRVNSRDVETSYPIVVSANGPVNHVRGSCPWKQYIDPCRLCHCAYPSSAQPRLFLLRHRQYGGDCLGPREHLNSATPEQGSKGRNVLARTMGGFPIICSILVNPLTDAKFSVGGLPYM
jgi:hypothetical protein